MSTREIENYEQFNKRLDISDPPPPPEPIYDLTTSDKTELVKAAGPIERGKSLSYTSKASSMCDGEHAF
jgi:hypothetical protein